MWSFVYLRHLFTWKEYKDYAMKLDLNKCPGKIVESLKKPETFYRQKGLVPTGDTIIVDFKKQKLGR